MIQRFFAWGIDQVMRIYEPRIAPVKQQLLGGVAGRVVELGPGTGPNLKYFGKGVEWIGIEPNPHMHPYIHREAARLGQSVQVIQGSALAIPLPDQSVDYVVGTLLLCSVPDPAKTLLEIKRVLKPGGEYRFIEHVAGEPGSLVALAQRVFKPLWRCCADGCNIDRRSWEYLEAAAFGHLELERFRMKMPLVSPHLRGVARMS